MKSLSKVQVDLGDRSYWIQIGQGWSAELGGAVKALLPERRCVIVADPRVQRHWGGKVLQALGAAGLDASLLPIPEGEEAKSLETVSAIYDYLIERKYGRQTAIVALGGGVVGDVAGFAAATFLRGVGLVQVPTTLLAMVDSSVGGKTGVNHRLGKNLIGAFKQPSLVAIDLEFLSTLAPEELKSGMAEVVKYGMIADAELFEFLESNAAAILEGDEEARARIVARSCEIKAGVVGEDETEAGLRAILNFGHTFAHAIEAMAQYRGVRHGEAVAMGMIAACRLGEIVEGFPRESTERLARLLRALGLPTAPPRKPVERYLEFMRSDKKVKSGKIRFVVPKRIGEVAVRGDVDEAQACRALEMAFEG